MTAGYTATTQMSRRDAEQYLSRVSHGTFYVENSADAQPTTYDDILEQVKDMPDAVTAAAIHLTYEDDEHTTYLQFTPQTADTLTVPRNGFVAAIPTPGFDTYKQLLNGHDWK